MSRPVPKTPYEIRLELLQLSYTILLNKHNVSAAPGTDAQPVLAPTSEEVITEAEKLNTFVSKSTNSH